MHHLLHFALNMLFEVEYTYNILMCVLPEDVMLYFWCLRPTELRDTELNGRFTADILIYRQRKHRRN